MCQTIQSKEGTLCKIEQSNIQSSAAKKTNDDNLDARFVRYFASCHTVITPCAIPVNSTKEGVSMVLLLSWG